MRALIVFTRIPRPGHTKTRMIPYLGLEGAAKLHIAMLKDIASTVKAVDAHLFVYFTDVYREGSADEKTLALLKKIFGMEATYRLQKGNSLGDKMHLAIEEVLSEGYESCLLFGTDIPSITKKDLKDAFAKLKTSDLVFGPSKDGGYYLVGMKQGTKEIFESQDYGHASVLENTLEAAKIAGKTVDFIGFHEDLDEKTDVEHYLQERRKRRHLTETQKVLMRRKSISIIVPLYNEVSTIYTLLEQLIPLKRKCEIILVDGGSTDGTVEILNQLEREESTIQIIQELKGRAKQMNAGALASKGDILFFLHADSEIPMRPLEEIRRVMARYRVGCFGIAFHSKKFFLWTCRVISNHRVFDRRVMFGDQGIFLERELFFEAGMFPEIPIMEDYQFSLTLKEMGEKFGMTRHRIYTSDRRFPKRMIPMLREMWKMNRLRKMYRDGVSPDVLQKLYKDVR